jgi:hypothetical protein
MNRMWPRGGWLRESDTRVWDIMRDGWKTDHVLSRHAATCRVSAYYEHIEAHRRHREGRPVRGGRVEGNSTGQMEVNCGKYGSAKGRMWPRGGRLHVK